MGGLAVTARDDAALGRALGHEGGEGLRRVRLARPGRDAEARAADGRAHRAQAAGIGNVGIGQPRRAVGFGIGREAIDEGAIGEVVARAHGVLQRDGVPVERLRRAGGGKLAQHGEHRRRSLAPDQRPRLPLRAGVAQVGGEGEKAHEGVHAVQAAGKTATARQRQHLGPGCRRPLGQQIGPVARGLAGGVDRHRPQPLVPAIGRERRPDELIVRQQVIERPQQRRLGGVADVRMIEDQQVVRADDLFERPELEARERLHVPGDVHAGVPLGKGRRRRDHRIDGAAVVPGQALEPDRRPHTCHARCTPRPAGAAPPLCIAKRRHAPRVGRAWPARAVCDKKGACRQPFATHRHQ